MKAFRYRVIRAIVFAMLLSCVHVELSSQPLSCSERYSAALKYYEMGRIDSTYQILQGCLKDSRQLKSVTKKEQRDIYRLAADAAYYLGLYDEADLYTREFRTLYPTYTPREEDLMEFEEQIQTTRIYPKMFIGLKIAYSWTRHEITKRFTPYYDYDNSITTQNLNLMIGLQIKRYIHPRITIGTELIYGDLTTFNHITINPIKRYDNIYGGSYYGESYVDINAIEWPVYLSLNMLNSKDLLLTADLGFSLTYPVNPWLPYRDDFEHKKSDSFGKYYSIYDHSNGYTCAYFFESPLEYNLLTGMGVAINMGVMNLALNFRYFPKIFRSDPLKGGSSIEDIPESDDLYYYDDIFQIRLYNHFQVSISMGFNLRYRAY